MSGASHGRMRPGEWAAFANDKHAAALALRGVHCTLGGREVLRDINLRVDGGELVALLGANGAGKSSLLRCALGLLRCSLGTAAVHGCAPASLTPTERARTVAYLPQLRPLAWPLRVLDTVALGRFAHGARLGHLGQRDAAAVQRALQACDLAALANQRMDRISGGEQARAHCARALATEAPLLLVDEPTAALDLCQQHRCMTVLRNHVDGHPSRRSSADAGEPRRNPSGVAQPHSPAAGTPRNAVLAALHDPALAARYADRLVWLKDGRVVADGSPQDTLTAALLAEVYGLRAVVHASSTGPELRVLGTL